ncbi:hypothetical protein ACRAWD_17090 [Caulobacter segnis]
MTPRAPGKAREDAQQGARSGRWRPRRPSRWSRRRAWPRIAPLRESPEELKPAPAKVPRYAPDRIEPNRKRRIVKEHDPIGARLDMHGLDQDRGSR